MPCCIAGLICHVRYLLCTIIRVYEYTSGVECADRLARLWPAAPAAKDSNRAIYDTRERDLLLRIGEIEQYLRIAVAVLQILPLPCPARFIWRPA